MPSAEPTPPNVPALRVVVPVKAFDRSKARLADALSPPERAALAERLATAVVRGAAPWPVVVVCDDDGVAVWATALGASVVRSDGLDLSGSVQAAVDGLDGADLAAVVHADLAAPGSLGPFLAAVHATARADEVVLVPDRHGDGSNVLVVPVGRGFRFAYGPGSAARHQQEAAGRGLSCRTVVDAGLGWDVDVPADLPQDGRREGGRPGPGGPANA